MRSFLSRCRPSSFPPLHWMTRSTSLTLRLPWRYCCSYLLHNTQGKCGRWKRRSTSGVWAIWFCIKPKSHQTLGSANDLPPIFLHKTKKWGKKKKRRIKCSPVAKNIYMESADEKYLHCGDNTLQEWTVSNPNTNNLFSQQLGWHASSLTPRQS